MKRLWGSLQSFLNKGRVEKYISSGTSTGGLVTLSLWKFALCQKNSLSERSEFEFFRHAFSKSPEA